MGTNDSLHLCIPVKHKQHETNPPPSKPSCQSCVESVSDTQGSNSKRPRSGTRTSKKEVDTKVKTEVKKVVKDKVVKDKVVKDKEVEAGYNSEADPDSEPKLKDNWVAKEEDS